MFGAALGDPGPRRRPHRLPPDARREPVRVERQSDDRARHPGTAARAAGAWRPARRRRPAPDEDRRGSRRARSRSGPAPTRCSCSRSCTCCSPTTSSTSARSPTHVNGRRRRARAVADAFTPEAVAPHMRDRRGRRSAASRASSPARRRAAVYARIGTCTQEFGTLASWLVDVLNVLTGNLDRPGGAMFAKPRRGRRQHGRQAGHGPRRALRAPAAHACAGCPSSSASSPSCASPRRSRRRATGRSER